MPGLTFTINPDASFLRKPGKRFSTRELLWLGQRSRINPAQASLEAPTLDRGQIPAGPGVKIRLAARRDFPTNPVCPSNAVHRVMHSVYKTYSISTTLRANGTWVASYARPKGPEFYIDGERRAVAETIPYLAETLALADARLGIDALIKSARRSQPRHQAIDPDRSEDRLT